MAKRSFFVLQPAQSPTKLVPVPAPLLTQQDLWPTVRGSGGSSLIFRVRSDGNYGDALGIGDRLESCVGLVDESVRWRVAFGSLQMALGIIQHEQLKAICHQAQLVISQHPATVPPSARADIINNVQKIIMDTPQGVKKPHGIDAALAMGIAAVAQCESGTEAAQYVPFASALCPFEENTEEYADRMATLDVMSGCTLLSAACARLAERAPAWLFAEMPQIAASAGEDDDSRTTMRPPQRDEA